jgi:hypothetical protein
MLSILVFFYVYIYILSQWLCRRIIEAIRVLAVDQQEYKAVKTRAISALAGDDEDDEDDEDLEDEIAPPSPPTPVDEPVNSKQPNSSVEPVEDDEPVNGSESEAVDSPPLQLPDDVQSTPTRDTSIPSTPMTTPIPAMSLQDDSVSPQPKKVVTSRPIVRKTSSLEHSPSLVNRSPSSENSPQLIKRTSSREEGNSPQLIKRTSSREEGNSPQLIKRTSSREEGNSPNPGRQLTKRTSSREEPNSPGPPLIKRTSSRENSPGEGIRRSASSPAPRPLGGKGRPRSPRASGGSASPRMKRPELPLESQSPSPLSPSPSGPATRPKAYHPSERKVKSANNTPRASRASFDSFGSESNSNQVLSANNTPRASRASMDSFGGASERGGRLSVEDLQDKLKMLEQGRSWAVK